MPLVVEPGKGEKRVVRQPNIGGNVSISPFFFPFEKTACRDKAPVRFQQGEKRGFLCKGLRPGIDKGFCSTDILVQRGMSPQRMIAR